MAPRCRLTLQAIELFMGAGGRGWGVVLRRETQEVSMMWRFLQLLSSPTISWFAGEKEQVV